MKEKKGRKRGDLDEITHICFNISAARKMKGWSQAELAERCKMTAAAISLIEGEFRLPNALSLKKIAEALGVSTDSLLGIFKISEVEKELISNAIFNLKKRDQSLLANMINWFENNKD